VLEAIKGLNIADPKFIVPIVICVVALAIIASIAKKILKLAILIGVVIFAVTVYTNLPSFKIDGSTATLKMKGKEYTVDTRDIRIVDEEADGKTKIFLVSGNTKIELPFSMKFAQKFILDKVNEELSKLN